MVTVPEATPAADTIAAFNSVMLVTVVISDLSMRERDYRSARVADDPAPLASRPTPHRGRVASIERAAVVASVNPALISRYKMAPGPMPHRSFATEAGIPTCRSFPLADIDRTASERIIGPMRSTRRSPESLLAMTEAGGGGSDGYRSGGCGARTAGVEVCNRRSRSACRSVWVFANIRCRWLRTVGSLIPSMAAASLAPSP
jgi:hypothetical protein